MKQIGMIANRDFEYRDKIYFAGDRFRVTPIDAAIIKRTQNARLTTPLDGEDAAAVDAPPAPSQTKDIQTAPPKPKRRPRQPGKTSKPRKPRTNRRDIPHAPVTK